MATAGTLPDDAKTRKELKEIVEQMQSLVSSLTKMPEGEAVNKQFLQGWLNNIQTTLNNYSTKSQALSAQNTQAQNIDSGLQQNASSAVASFTKTGATVAGNIR